MYRDSSQQAYNTTSGTGSTNYPIVDGRDPTANDVQYQIGRFWINQVGIRLWYLNKLSNASGVLQATWELISVSTVLASLSDTSNTVVFPSSSIATPPDNIQLVGGTGITVVATPASNLLTITNTGSGTETLTGNDAVAVSPTAGTIQTLGVTVANATYGQALYTNAGGGNVENFNIQLSAAIASTAVASVGVSAFSSAQFAVDGNGFVTLKGGATPPTLGLTPDAHTGPGTSPVVPNGSGDIILEGGATFATGTQANPIRTNSLAANTIDFQIQLAGSHAATSTANDFGVSQFDSNSFTVTSGYVALKNGGTTGAVTGIEGDDSNLIVPASGIITFNGDTVANATNAQPVYFAKNSTSAEYLQVQVTTTSTSGAKNINNAGLASFDSASFNVDSGTGFISLKAGGTDIQTLTGNSGGAISPTAGNINTLGTGSITIVGSGSTLTTQLTGLTANSVLYGLGTATIGLVASGTTGQVLQTNTGAAPTYSTATYPSTTTINQILYSSSSNVVAGLTTANDGVLTTGTSGTPVITPLAVNGQLIIGSGSGAPAAAVLTAGPGVSIVNGSNAITISATGSSILAYKNVTHAASPYTVLTTDQYISVDCSGGVVTLKFPDAPTSYQVWYVKDRTGSASTSNISITTVSGGDTIDGLTTYKLTSNYAAVNLIFNGSNYEVW